MATILIADDDAMCRKYLVTVLGDRGHRLLQASDGAEALALVQAERPDLVFADILMPTMDGYELVRRLRTDPPVADTRVIFYSGAYHHQEALALARNCGVQHVLAKPARQEVILQTVDAVLAGGPQPVPQAPGQAFEREHLRLVTDRLAHEVQDFEATNARIVTILELGQRLTQEHDPQKLLEAFCQAARDILGAEYAALGMLDASGQRLSPLLISGVDSETAARLGAPSPQAGLLGQLLAGGRPLRLRDISTDPEAANFLRHHPPVRSFLGVPIGTPSQLYGLLCVTGKIGREEFGADEEHVAVTLTAQLAIAYENLLRYDKARSHAAKLEEARRQAKRRLEDRDARLRALFEHAQDGILLVDDRGRYVDANPAACSLLGYSREELLEMSVWHITSAANHGRGRELWQQFLTAGKQEGESVLQRKGGTAVETEFRVVANIVPGVHLCILRDVTERKRTEEELRKNAKLLQALYRRLLEAQETERRHIARELHDEIGQVLTTVSIYLQAAKAVADAPARSHLEEGVVAVDRAIEQVRDLSLSLRPSVLDGLGLQAALEWYAERQKQRASFALHLDARLHDKRLPPDVEVTCFRIVQEALTNVVRHAQAQHVWAEVEQREGDLQLVVRDDGLGFDVAATRQRAMEGKSLGLLNMQERAQLLGGTLGIESAPGRGTTLRARLPVDVQGKGGI